MYVVGSHRNRQVSKYAEHPAILMWSFGNELNGVFCSLLFCGVFFVIFLLFLCMCIVFVFLVRHVEVVRSMEWFHSAIKRLFPVW